MNYRNRLKKLKEKLYLEGLDGIIITKKVNIFYLSGYEIDDSILIVTSGAKNFIITDPRYKELTQEKASLFKLVLVEKSWQSAIKRIAYRSKIKNVCFESTDLTCNDYASLRKKIGKVKLLPRQGIVESLRVIKEPGEIILIKESARIVKKALYYIKTKINPRETGQGLAQAVDGYIRSHGADATAFRTIAAQSPYSSQPHARPTSRKFGKKAEILVDTGALYRGYNSDLTRMYFLGKISPKCNRIYNIIKSAQNRAIEKIRPGIPISLIDKTARQYIKDKGLGRFFFHSLGHGVGLEIHEYPRISSTTKGYLMPGMVFTIEPGVYIRGWGGVRLEDMVVVTKRGFEVITHDIPK